jgi:hypothetical protein
VPQFSDIRKVIFELIADPREIASNRIGVNMMGHVDDIETEGIDCWFDWEAMKLAERNPGI